MCVCVEEIESSNPPKGKDTNDKIGIQTDERNTRAYSGFFC